MLLVGSQAAKFHSSRWRDPQDIDVVATFDAFSAFIKKHELKATLLPNKKFLAMWNGVHMEFEIAWVGTTAESMLWVTAFFTCSAQVMPFI